jgi:hypothetical protein
MQAILIDNECLPSFLILNYFSQLSSNYRDMINSFMEKLKAENPQNVLIKFNIALITIYQNSLIVNCISSFLAFLKIKKFKIAIK